MSNSSPPRKTFADYAAIAVCPVLVMLVVGSLIFFLLAIGYAGSHLGELRWTLFWFVLAMVLVSRIAVERGSEHAWIYGLGLAAATGFMLLQYIAVNLWVWGLLGLIWWATHKLTWDCTVIDDDQDASGEGLLQAAKLHPLENEMAAASPEPIHRPLEPDRKPLPEKAPRQVPRGERRLAKPSAPARQPHAPGIWVIYFSLAALPIFGLGQGLIAGQEVEARWYAFCLHFIYVAAALGLLLITSFLGLRRYLRQRYLQMPPAMAASWLTTGTITAAVILIGCLLLPRPNAYWSLTAMIDRLGDPPSRRAASASLSQEVPGRETSPEGEKSAPTNTTQSSMSAGERASVGKSSPPNEKTPRARPDVHSTSEPASSKGLQSSREQVEAGKKASPSEPATAAQRSPGEEESQTASRPTSRLSLRTPLKLLRLAIYAALIGIGVVMIIKNRERVALMLQEFWHALRKFWNSLFGKGAIATSGGGTPLAGKSRQPFAALVNPFTSGVAVEMSPEDLVVHSFRGLEAWAEKHHCGRHPDQTPFEFADNVAAEVPDLAHEAQQVTSLYVQVAYAKAAVLPACRTILEILWSKMTEAP